MPLELSPELAIALQMPFPAHRIFARGVPLGIKQEPQPSARRACTGSGIVLGEAPLQIRSPADVGAIPPFGGTT